MKLSKSLPIIAALSVLFGQSLEAADNNWPAWRGPTADGVAPAGAKPPIQWSEKKNVKWKVGIPGNGNASPIVWGDRIFLATAIKQEKKEASVGSGPSAGDPTVFVQQQGSDQRRGRRGGRGGDGGEKLTDAYKFDLLCIDRKGGKTIWQKTAIEEVPHEGHHRHHGFASGSPVTDGKHVYAFFGSRGLYCFTMDGELKWKKRFGKMTMRGTFGEGVSPVLADDALIINWDHEGDSFLIVLDKTTGDEKWKVERDEATTWATPLIVEHGGSKQIVTNGHKAVRAYDLKTSEIVWQCGGQTMRPVSSPVSGNGMAYIGSGFRGARVTAVKLGNKGKLDGSKAIAWTIDQFAPDVPSLLLSHNRIYYLSRNTGILTCRDATTGKAHYERERVDGLSSVYASPVAAGGNIYFIDREGSTTVIKDSDKLETVAVNKLDDPIDASPAIVGNEIILRGKKFLYCIAEK